MKKIIAITVVLAILAIYFFIIKVDSNNQFTTKKWIDAGKKNTNVYRIEMIDELLKKYKLKGMKKEEVIKLLGSADKTNYFKNWDMVYWLGPERGFISIDSEWLVLKLDTDNTVVDAKVLRD